MSRRGAALALALTLAACAAKEPAPVAVDTQNDQCAFCRMSVSDPHFASEIVAPGEETKVFDDLGCLRDHLKAHPLAPGAVVFVADHRTGAFVRARAATFSRLPSLATPMDSHLVAHADAASRDADAAAARPVPVPAAEVLGR